MKPPRVLVVEDDAALAAGIVSGLKQAGFEVELLTHGGEVARRVLGESFDAVVLDLMLPEQSGFEVMAELKHRSSTPILVLTARSELDDRLRSFELGAADYLPKPFWMGELVARLEARMQQTRVQPNRVVKFGDVEVDLDARQVRLDGKPLELTKTELDVLLYLTQRPGRAVSRDQLAESVLPEVDDTRTVDAHVARIRKKLGPAAAAIATVWGIGYRFDA
jgi:DNA-binding response OmpR family regulator